MQYVSPLWHPIGLITAYVAHDSWSHYRPRGLPGRELSRRSISRRSLRSESRPYEKGSSSRKIPGGKRMPPRTARVSPSGESRSSIETENPYSTARRVRISLAWAQNPQRSWVSNRTLIALRSRSFQSSTDIGSHVGHSHIQ